MPRLSVQLVFAVLMVFSATTFAADIDVKGSVPAIAADGDLVALVVAEPNSLACAISHDGGVTFAAPAPVGKVAGGQMLGMRRGPQIAVHGNTILIVTNNAKGRRLVAFRSLDAGKTWQEPALIDNPAGRSSEGLFSIAPTRNGFAVVFLELVEKSMRISLTRSTDEGKTWEDSRIIYTSPDGHVCECCQPTITSDRTGNITVMFRNWLGGNRDMYTLVSKNDGTTFAPAQKLGYGSWKLNACPMDGGGLTYGIKDKNKSKDTEKSPLAIFRRESILYTARPGEIETKVAIGKNAVVAATADGPVLAWVTKSGVTARIPNSPELTIDGAVAPVLTRTSQGVLLAYTIRDGTDYKTHTQLVWKSAPATPTPAQ